MAERVVAGKGAGKPGSGVCVDAALCRGRHLRGLSEQLDRRIALVLLNLHGLLGHLHADLVRKIKITDGREGFHGPVIGRCASDIQLSCHRTSA